MRDERLYGIVGEGRPQQVAADTLESLAVAAVDAQDPDAELDLDPALATCVQQSLRGPPLARAAPDTEPRPGTVSAFGMHLRRSTAAQARRW